ncbi:hypothetical protein EJB05_21139, partial [Eragrostis curvula]
MDNSAVSMGLSFASFTSGSYGQSQITFGSDRLGSTVDNGCSNGHRGLHRSSHAPAQDDGCRLSFSFSDPGTLSLGPQQGRRNAGAVQRSEAFAGNIISFGAVDEGSTSSARRSSGVYMPSLFFTPQPNYSAAVEEGGTDSGNDDTVHAAHGTAGQPQVSEEVPVQRVLEGRQRRVGLCIAHGGGQRCQKPGCHKGAESRTAYCKAHGGGHRCQQLGCTKSAEGKTDHCIAHGGGRRCGHAGCPKAARGKSGRCIKHGGGKRCSVDGCIRSAEGRVGLCISHGGGRRCQYPDCRKGAQGSTLYCKAHGGGKRCVFEGCGKGAEGSTPLCKAHGGGKRCLYEGGGVCPKSVHGGTEFCVAHGGGKRTEFCKAHGGGKRCTYGGSGCDKFARGRSGLCAAHGTLVAAQQRRASGVGGGNAGAGLIGPGLFHGIVPSASGGVNNNEYSSSGVSTVSDCDGSPVAGTRRQELIPPQVLVPHSMKSPPSVRSREGGAVAFPEGRVHGGGLLTLLGGSFRNVIDVDKL